jgi:glycosyltransferase 2 family protein
MSRKIPGWIQFLVLLALGLLLLGLAFRGQDWGAIAAQLRHARWEWVAFSLVLTLLGHLARARRWQLLIHAAGHRAGLLPCFVTLMTGYLTNLGLPRLGEVSRCASLNRLTGAPILALGGTVVMERAVDLLTLAVLLATAIALAGREASTFYFRELMGPLESLMGWKLALLGITAVIGLLALYWVAFRIPAREDGYRKRMQGWAHEVWKGLVAATRLRPLAMAEFGLHTVIIWASYYSAPLCTLLALGVPAADLWGLAFYVFVFGSLSRTLPLPVGSAGAYHFIVSGWMVFVGYEKVIGLGVATLNHAVQTLFYLAAGSLGMLGFFILLRTRRRSAHSQPIANSNTPTP